MPEVEESIAVDNSVQDGNVPPVAPSEPAKTEIPAEPKVEPTEPVVPKVELFDLPDGRKVTGGELFKEHTEKLLPEFTRRSQELAKLKEGTLPDKKPADNPYADPSYVPQSYEEILKVAEERALAKLDAREQAKVEQHQAIQKAVVEQLAEVKKLEPTLNENALFLHANKYGFQDLKLAFQNMKDMSEVVKKTQATTAQNIAKRNDPVSISPGASGAKLNPDDFSSAREYLRALKGTG